MTKPAKMGRAVTTQRGRTAGAREARTWLSADEYAEVERLAQEAGLTTSGWVRARLLAVDVEPAR